MEPFTSPAWNPEWIWGFGIIVLGAVLALTMFYARHLDSRQRAARDSATRRNYARDDANE